MWLMEDREAVECDLEEWADQVKKARSVRMDRWLEVNGAGPLNSDKNSTPLTISSEDL